MKMSSVLDEESLLAIAAVADDVILAANKNKYSSSKSNSLDNQVYLPQCKTSRSHTLTW